MSWSPSSWRSKPVQQMAEYADKAEADAIFDKLGKLPPLVQPAEVDRLQQVLAAAAAGERFIVQGGDCAERFMDCEAERLEKQLKRPAPGGRHWAPRPVGATGRLGQRYSPRECTGHLPRPPACHPP